MKCDNMNENNLIDLFVNAWKNLDAEVIIPYLAPDFKYSSCWVYSSLDCQGYIDYIRRKFETLRKVNSQIIVEKGFNEIGKPAVVLTQGGEKIYLTIEVKDGKIKRADLMPF